MDREQNRNFINGLKKNTSLAIEKAEWRANKLAKKSDEELCKQKEIYKKAAWVMKQMPERARFEACLGRNYAIVMSIKHTDYDRPYGENNHYYCQEAWLNGAAKLVFERCKKIGLNPTLEAWFTNTDSGFNIVIHW